MNQQKFVNGTAGVTLAAKLAANAMSAKLAPGKGALFPMLTGGDYYLVWLTNAGNAESAFEVVRASGATDDVLIITQREVEGAKRDWDAGAKCECRFSAARLNALMPPTGSRTVEPGEPLSVSLPEGYTLTVVSKAANPGTGTVTRQSSSDQWTITPTSGKRTIGGYQGTQELLINSTAGGIDVVVGDAVLAAPRLDSTKPQMLVRPDSSTVRLTGQHGYSLGVISDSRDDVAFQSIGLPNPGNWSQPASGLKWALGRAGHPFLRTADAARASSGCTPATSTIHPTFQEQLATVRAAMPTHCWVRVPINDPIQGQSADVTFSYFQPIVDDLVAAGIQVELLTCSTLAPNFSPGYSASVQQEILKLNALVRATYGTSGAGGVAVHDVAHTSCIAGSTVFNGVALAKRDAIHDTNVGGFLEGAVVAADWIRRGLKPMPLLATHAGDCYRNVGTNSDTPGTVLNAGSNNYMPNGTFELGAPVNGLAQGWKENAKSNATVNYSIVAAPVWNGESKGNGQKVDVTFTDAGGYVELCGPDMWGDVKLMRRYVAAILFTIADNPVNLKNVRAILEINASLNTSAVWSQNEASDTGMLPVTTGFSEVALMDLDLSIAPTLAHVAGSKFRMKLVISGSNGSASVTFSRAVARCVN